ncbi:unnamed protein product [Phytophthora fragariaefolia]|uniref:Unnamed protein product n=1 Tax=Phytophthora fragariaefolia TaxID=1490495 RepID=A0A9W7CW51_9STRA|nr:unnamed protein product [Phytophthora fragariaefolia]
MSNRIQVLACLADDDYPEFKFSEKLVRRRVMPHMNELCIVQLDLSGNQLENVNGIQALRRLQSLDLSRNCIATLDLLALLPALQVLKVAENSLTAIDALQLLPELRVVDASYNRISKWPPLAGLSLLETLDLSDNMLGAFPPSLSATLFPSRLRRLSIARNGIDKVHHHLVLAEMSSSELTDGYLEQLCGVASLGVLLPMLEFFAFDGNPIVREVSRNGGQLERLLAMFFPRLPLSNDGGLTMSGRRHDEFITPLQMVHSLKRAVLEGREEALGEFLVLGSITDRMDSVGVPGTLTPPPPPVELPLPSRHQLAVADAGDVQSAIDNSLSHDSKIEIWKRIQEDRKAQFAQSNGLAFTNNALKKDKLVRWEQHNEQPDPVPLLDDVRQPALTAADLAAPEPSPQTIPALDASSLSVMRPLETTLPPSVIDPMKGSPPQNSPDNDALVRKVRTLTEQVVTMRKYMKIWRAWKKMLQDRKKVLRGACSFAGRINASSNVRWYGLLNEVLRCSRDVRQLQQVCAVQDAAISNLWDNQTGFKSNTEVKALRAEHLEPLSSFSSSNNGQRNKDEIDSSPEMYSATEVNELKKQLEQQAHEMDILKQQLQTLQNLVASLAVTKIEDK